MPVLTEALGSELESRTQEITSRMILAFAAGVGEIGARTFDDASPTFIAARCFCASLEWPVISQNRRSSLLGLGAEELRMGVHVEQDSTFHRPICPGDRLQTSGRIVGLSQTSAGTLVQFKLLTTNADDGGPVTTTRYGTIFRGVALMGDGGILETATPYPSPAIPLTESIQIPIATEAAHIYTECSGIWNPIHSERRVALDAGLPGIILHGTAIWALAGRELGRHYGAADPERLVRLRARFRTPVIPGTSVTLRHGSDPSGRDIYFTMQLDDGRIAVSDGYAAFVPAGSI